MRGLVFSLQASTPSANFHPNPPKFPRFISENDVPDRYNIAYGDPIDKNWLKPTIASIINLILNSFPAKQLLMSGQAIYG